MNKYLLLLIFITTFVSCNSKPKGVFSNNSIQTKVDYSKTENWAALPTKKDLADRTPHPDLKDLQSDAEADVFYVYPTTYTRKRGFTKWNPTIDDTVVNTRTDETAILNQASVFNGAGKIYAPRYRQAHIQAYYTKDKSSAKQAFELAYSDVKSAFEYYLKHYNNGRPIILAAHSQGTNHTERLIDDFFDGKKLQEHLIVAYLVGMPIPYDRFKNIKVCESAVEVGCFCSWRTWKKGAFPKYHKPKNNIAVTNPLTWKTNNEFAPKEMNKGSVLQKFEKKFTRQLVDAQVEDGVLWANKPKFPGSFLLTFKNYHIADLNFYYVNVRENAILRKDVFIKKPVHQEGGNK